MLYHATTELRTDDILQEGIRNTRHHGGLLLPVIGHPTNFIGHRIDNNKPEYVTVNVQEAIFMFDQDFYDSYLEEWHGKGFTTVFSISEQQLDIRALGVFNMAISETMGDAETKEEQKRISHTYWNSQLRADAYWAQKDKVQALWKKEGLPFIAEYLYFCPRIPPENFKMIKRHGKDI
ncbi:hypothetical protein [Enterococcus sp. AZ072]|uniref:hypothetical protein n=1 Tax=unclassified Enterococcus TaxID=2608891 RepID=UPI003D2BA2D9